MAAARTREQQAVVDYLSTDGCRMSYLRRELDDPEVDRDCGRCDNCTGVQSAPVMAGVEAAQTFLRAQDAVLVPRRQWPRGLAVVKGNIGPAERLEEGRALCADGDGGWSALVDRVLSGEADVDEELLGGLAGALKRWDWDRRPTWITTVPSRSRGAALAAVAAGLGRLGRLDVLDVVRRAEERPPQDAMGNSAHQLLNVWDAFSVEAPAGDWPAGPVLLLDDEWRSGWTMTVLGRLLRAAGTGPVMPLVLRRTS
ncbi:MAG: RecQ family zinc-binding domain-containing protein [Acidimicrobiales bacterium]